VGAQKTAGAARLRFRRNTDNRQNTAGSNRSCYHRNVCGQSASGGKRSCGRRAGDTCQNSSGTKWSRNHCDAVSAQRATAAKRPCGHRGGDSSRQPQAPPRDLKQSLKQRRRVSVAFSSLHLFEQIVRAGHLRFAGRVLNVELFDHAIFEQHGVTFGANAKPGAGGIQRQIQRLGELGVAIG